LRLTPAGRRPLRLTPAGRRVLRQFGKVVELDDVVDLRPHWPDRCGRSPRGGDGCGSRPKGGGPLRLTAAGWRTAAADGRRVAGAAAHEWRVARTSRARATVGVTRAVVKVFQLAFQW
jgi:hypothetical protein